MVTEFSNMEVTGKLDIYLKRSLVSAVLWGMEEGLMSLSGMKQYGGAVVA